MSTNFSKNPKYEISPKKKKKSLVGVTLIHAHKWKQTDIMKLRVTFCMWMDFKKIHFYFQEDINFFCAQTDLLVQDT